MHVRYVTTAGFWRAMCTAGFHRLTDLTGILKGEYLWTLECPEQVVGELERANERIQRALRA